MAEARDTCVAAGKIPSPASLRAHDELDMIARRVTKADESFHLAPRGLLHGARVHVMAERFQRCGGVLQAGFILDLETDGLVARIAFRIAQRVRALIGPEIQGVLPTLGDLQAEAG